MRHLSRYPRANVLLWVLYDFANSFIYIAFFLYYSQWVVIDSGIPDFWFNACFAIVALLLLFTAPFIGSRLDGAWSNIRGLRITTVLIVMSYAITALLALQGLAAWSLVSFTVGLYFFILSFVFYTPLLFSIATNKNRGLVSGLGFMGNFIGLILGLFLTLPFATGQLSIFGGDNRVETILPALGVFLLFALPMLSFFKEQSQVNEVREENVFKKTMSLFSSRNITLFVIAFMLFYGAVQTVSNNFPIMLENLWQVADTTKSFIIMATIALSALGSIVAGRLIDMYGWKTIALGTLSSGFVVLLLMASAGNLTLFLAYTMVASVLVGAIMTMARVTMSHLLPATDQNFGFSYFTIIERASTIATPLIWGLIVSGLVSLEGAQYRIAIGAMAVFILTSLFVLLAVRAPRIEVN